MGTKSSVSVGWDAKKSAGKGPEMMSKLPYHGLDVDWVHSEEGPAEEAHHRGGLVKAVQPAAHKVEENLLMHGPPNGNGISPEKRKSRKEQT